MRMLKDILDWWCLGCGSQHRHAGLIFATTNLPLSAWEIRGPTPSFSETGIIPDRGPDTRKHKPPPDPAQLALLAYWAKQLYGMPDYPAAAAAAYFGVDGKTIRNCLDLAKRTGYVRYRGQDHTYRVSPAAEAEIARLRAKRAKEDPQTDTTRNNTVLARRQRDQARLRRLAEAARFSSHQS
jgi:hypothetical protein